MSHSAGLAVAEAAVSGTVKRGKRLDWLFAFIRSEHSEVHVGLKKYVFFKRELKVKVVWRQQLLAIGKA